MPERKLLSIVVPVLNEKENIEPLYHTVKSVISAIADRYDYEFLFADNHSTDGTSKRYNAWRLRTCEFEFSDSPGILDFRGRF